ncbi:MAG TPA: YIP1 family protein [Holophagaceae bacterium]|nr:YIP1 family protein [Holophagaceae bacterium]
MTENPYTPPEAALFGGGSVPPKTKAPGLMEQIEGVFTAPVELFKKLHDTPSWAPAFTLALVFIFIMLLVWSFRVDADAFLRPIMERNPKVPADQIDTIIGIQKKFLFLSAVFAPVGAAIGMFLMGLIYWGLGIAFAEDAKPTYTQSLVASTVPGLVTIPWMLLITVLCLLKGPVTIAPERVAPTSLGYFMATENLKLSAFLFSLDLFAIASWVLTFLACRHALRMKPLGAFLCTAIVVLISVGFKVIGAK